MLFLSLMYVKRSRKKKENRSMGAAHSPFGCNGDNSEPKQLKEKETLSLPPPKSRFKDFKKVWLC